MKGGALRPIKIALVINGFLIGGAQNVLVQILKRVDRSRFEPVLITLIRSSDDEARYLYSAVPEGVPVYDLRFKNFRDVRSWRKLYRVLREVNPDVVFANLFFSNTVLRVLKPLFRYAVITAEHNTYHDKTWLQRAVDRLLAGWTYRIVAVSNTVANFTSAQEHIPRSKFTIVYGGVDVPFIQKTIAETDKSEIRRVVGCTDKDKVILNVARIVPQKNHRLMIDGFELFLREHPEYFLLVVGGGSHLEEMRGHAEKLGIGSRIRFMGYQKELYPFFALADFFVSTSLIEGFGTTHAEALAAGLPLVSTKTAGPDEMIHEGVNGFFIPEYTKEAVAESLAKMVVEPLAPMREAAQRSAETYSLDNMVARYEKLFTEAASA